MANDVIRYIKDTRAKIAGLKKILKDMDPASGVSISLRRGVARDNDAVENDDERRPWVTIECSNMEWARSVIETAIRAATETEQLWLTFAKTDHEELGKFLAAETKTK